MTDLLPAPWPAILFGLAIVAVAGVILYQRLHRLVPRGWTHAGIAPESPLAGFADVALEVLGPLCPGMQWGGTIQWVAAPWPAGYASPQELVAGQVLDFARQAIRLVIPAAPEDIDQTALAHEIDHLRRQSAEEGTDGWVVRANDLIRARLVVTGKRSA
jgi:hypothetical protein